MRTHIQYYEDTYIDKNKQIESQYLGFDAQAAKGQTQPQQA
jgi:hypothetical protein